MGSDRQGELAAHEVRVGSIMVVVGNYSDGVEVQGFVEGDGFLVPCSDLQEAFFGSVQL